jgi:hypothetical protein
MGTKIGLRGWLLFGAILLLPVGARAQDPPGQPSAAENGALPYPLLPITIDAQGYTARGQDYAPEEVQAPLPLGSTRPESGLFYGSEFIFFRQTRPIKDQLIAVRGFFDVTGESFGNGPLNPGTFVGSGEQALKANNLGTRSYQPGFEIFLGWRFKEGVTVEFDWYHLWQVHYSGGATLVPSLFQGQGTIQENTFLTSFVYNFTPDYAGPPGRISGTGFAAYGIWDAASIMDMAFYQRYDEYDIKGRIPMFESDWNRSYALMGARFAWIWERFRWQTFAYDANGNSGPQWQAVYSNVDSNRMYGPFIGCGDECRLGDTPIGTFAISLDTTAAALLDIVKTRQSYERADRQTSSRHNTTMYEIVPEVTANLNLWWYPQGVEGMQLRVGYDLFAFFNTVGSPYPVAFNLAAPESQFQAGIFRFFDGFIAGIALSF